MFKLVARMLKFFAALSSATLKHSTI